jgi:AmmeMemoRadiSam system protein A
MLNSKQGKQLIELARKSIISSFENKDIQNYEINVDKQLKEKMGVFVTLTLDDNLRGCIGFPYQQSPLYKGVIEAAKAAAFEDMRFLPLTKEELNELKIEISVLTKPEEIKEEGEDIIKEIEVGKDGLIVEYSGFYGILLPQVASENHWDAEHFLEQACVKAGVSPKTWKNKSCKVYKFQAQIFSEK